MKRSPNITAFEHQTLTVGRSYGGVTFEPAQWEALIRLHPTLSHPYYSLIHQGIRLSHYVGVIKIPQLTLEILPKTDSTSSEAHWRTVLVDLLAECRYLRMHRAPNPLSAQQAGQWLDWFLLDFLSEVDRLCRRGLAKQYVTETGQQRALKGQLQFAEQIRRNLARQERFYVRHQSYNGQHHLHRLLKRAIQAARQLSTHPMVRQQSLQLLTYFAEIRDSDRVQREPPPSFDRRTEAYRTAVTLAYQILSAQPADVYQGERSLGFTLLLDMNLLFEEFVYQRLHRLSVDHDFRVRRQVSRSLWGETKVRPDLFITRSDGQSIIIDTKWKVLTRARPAAEDLHQLYVYNQLFEAHRGVLLYPQANNLSAQQQRFNGPGHSQAEVNFLSISDRTHTGLHSQLDEQLLQLVYK